MNPNEVRKLNIKPFKRLGVVRDMHCHNCRVVGPFKLIAYNRKNRRWSRWRCKGCGYEIEYTSSSESEFAQETLEKHMKGKAWIPWSKYIDVEATKHRK